METTVSVKCITGCKDFEYGDEPISQNEMSKLICDICNDKPLDYGNFYLEPVQISEIPTLQDLIKDIESSDEPEHYRAHGLSPLSAFKKGLLSKEELGGFIKGNIIKYTVRAGHKDSAISDIDKAIDYLNHLKELYKHD